MKIETKYIAEDGTPFPTPEACEAYEGTIAAYAGSTDIFDKNGDRLPYDLTQNELEKHMFVRFKTEEAATAYFQACDKIAFVAPLNANKKPVAGSFFFDASWHDVRESVADLDQRIGPLGNVVFHEH